ncbi:MAG: hypothetical protein ACQEXB_08760 [Bacillota bacterium]
MFIFFSFIAFSALVIAIVSVFFAIKGKYQFYFVSALGIYLFSFIAGFSIGQLTVGFTFIPLTLAIGYTFGWIKTKKHSMTFVNLGVFIGILMVVFVDDAWLFLPFWFLI